MTEALECQICLNCRIVPDCDEEKPQCLYQIFVKAENEMQQRRERIKMKEDPVYRKSVWNKRYYERTVRGVMG